MEILQYEQCLTLLQEAAQHESIDIIALRVYRLVFETDRMHVGAALTIESVAFVAADAVAEHKITQIDIQDLFRGQQAA